MAQREEANFLSLSAKYQVAQVEEQLADLRDEQQDEQKLSKTLNKDSQEKVDAIKDFLSANETLIQAQHDEAVSLAQDIKRLVAENQEKEHADLALQSVLSSDRMAVVARNLAELNAALEETRAFLVKTGRKGRAPISGSN
jgi:Fe-S cluster assembly scaffold protein SufB